MQKEEKIWFGSIASREQADKVAKSVGYAAKILGTFMMLMGLVFIMRYVGSNLDLFVPAINLVSGLIYFLVGTSIYKRGERRQVWFVVLLILNTAILIFGFIYGGVGILLIVMEYIAFRGIQASLKIK